MLAHMGMCVSLKIVNVSPLLRSFLQLDNITIPIGPRLGSVVADAKGLAKSFGDRMLIEDLDFSIPPGQCVQHRVFHSFFPPQFFALCEQFQHSVLTSGTVS